ncbi:hypothetical protein E5Q_02884 [Mixia osmundae IAM 14324]|uniref:Uncharacterized protein n=1 Tax=Mixia osmundae (strain CBS 9802 / IAM 14324 / JCM 22182 / KY 12970) TaxID=764103 RepID=G7E060_MIXOS|nr:hypothetical protein E5Q_02884 [Mixia osmundae IAM 14324]
MLLLSGEGYSIMRSFSACICCHFGWLSRVSIAPT